MSPIGDSLRNRARMYPGLVNCTTIDWFHTWPAEALQEVAMKFLSVVEFTESDTRSKISTVFAEMHLSVISASSRMLLELKRHNYVTPTNYLVSAAKGSLFSFFFILYFFFLFLLLYSSFLISFSYSDTMSE